MPRKYTHTPSFTRKVTDPEVLRAGRLARRKVRLAQMKAERPAEYRVYLDKKNAQKRKKPRKPGKPIDRGTVKGRIALILKRARKRAVRAGLEWNIGVADVYVPTHCPVLGIPLSTTPGERGPDRFSLDRSDSRKGYVKGNVRIISFRANTLKNNATAAELRAVADYVAAIEQMDELLS